jgi:predicted phosphohydrolase
MKIQYCSDLHLEFPDNYNFIKENPLKVEGDILVLAGDIVPFAHIEEFDDFFDYVSDNFEYVYWIPGNHEYYHYDISVKGISFNEQIRENVFLINNTSVVHGDVRFLFTTLWSEITPDNQWNIRSRLSDFRVINNKSNTLSINYYNYLHKQSVAFLKEELENNESENTVVVTHHVPTFKNYPEKYKSSNINQAFTVEMHDFINNSNIDCWIYGHHHINTEEFEINNTKLLTNQLGYVKFEKTNYVNGKFVELGSELK